MFKRKGNKQESTKNILIEEMKSKFGLFAVTIVLLWLSSLLLFIDMCFIEKYDLVYWIWPLSISIIGIVFLFYIFNVNLRSRYTSIPIYVFICVYFLIMIALLILIILNKRFMSVFMFILLFLNYIILLFALFICYRRASKSILLLKRKLSFCSLILVFISFISLLFFGMVTYSFGIFGQGNGYIHNDENEINKTLVYTYDEVNDGYKVVNTLGDKGNKITIPAKFNFKDVVSFDCSLFLEKDIEKFYFEERNVDINFTNKDVLINNQINILEKEFIFDSDLETYYHVRNGLLNAYKTDNSVIKNTFLELLNKLSPNLKDNQVSISFLYDSNTVDVLLKYDYELLGPWIGNKGDLFSIKNCLNYKNNEKFEYLNYIYQNDLVRSNINDESYQWCYEHLIYNNEKYIPLMDPIEETIQSQNVYISLHKIYALEFIDSNDTIYNNNVLKNVYTYETNGKKLKLAIKEELNSIISNIENRPGFEITWYEFQNNKVENVEEYISNYTTEVVQLRPQWQLIKPDLSSLIDKFKNKYSLKNNIIEQTYGDSQIQLEFDKITHDMSNSKFIYELNDIILNENNTSFNYKSANAGVMLNDEGNYVLSVTVKSDETSLIEKSTYEFSIKVLPRTISIDWHEPDDLIYDGYDKRVLFSWNTKDLVYNDVFNAYEFELSDQLGNTQDEAINSGNYKLKAIVPSNMTKKYTISLPEHNFEIEKRQLEITFGDYEKTYDGNKLKSNDFSPCSEEELKSKTNPRYNVKGLAITDSLDEIITFTCSNEVLNAKDVKWNGTEISYYDISLDLTTISYHKEKWDNYNVTQKQGKYTINRKEISVVWNQKQTFEYNSLEQWVNVESINGEIDQEEASILSSLIYQGKEINVGDDYTTIVTLPTSNTNYYFDNGNQTISYVITPRPLCIQFKEQTKTYDGNLWSKNFEDTSYVYTLYNPLDLPSNDSIDDILTFKMKDDVMNAKNKGEYTIDLDLAGCTHGIKWNNYTISSQSNKLTINQREVGLEWSGDSFIYNGKNQHPTVTNITNAVQNELDTLLNSFTYTGEGKEVGSYYLDATLSDQNYIINSNNHYLYNINPQPLTIRFKVELINKIYDGVALTEDDFLKNYYIEEGEMPDSLSEIFELHLKGDAIGALHKGTYTIDADYDRKELCKNYKVNVIPNECIISQCELIANWEKNTTFTYDGTIKEIKVISVSGEVAGEESEILNSLTYEGQNQYAGNHQMKAILPQSSDYIFQVGTDILDYQIERRNLTIQYQPQTKVYDGQIFNDEYSYICSGLAPTDSEENVLTLNKKGEFLSAINKGEYTISAEFTLETLGSNYNIQIITSTLSITPRPIQLTWEDKTFIYEGKIQYPNVSSIENDIETDNILTSIRYEGEGITAINKGQYTISAVLDNDNYQIVMNQTHTYNIQARDIEFVWSNQEIEYNGFNQHPSVIRIENVVAIEESSIIESITYNGEGIVKGNYQTTAILKNDNYNATSNISCTFQIVPKDLQIVYERLERTYDGQVYSDTFLYHVIGIAGNDQEENILKLTIKDEALNAKNKGTYTIDATYTLETLGSNYNIQIVTAQYIINAKLTTVEWNSQSTFTYDGLTKQIKVTKIVDAVSDDDAIQVLGSLTYTGESNIAGRHEMIAKLPSNSNYCFGYESGEEVNQISSFYEIEKRELTITFKSKSKVYDGKTYQNIFDYDVTNLASTDDEKNVITLTISDQVKNAIHTGKYVITASFQLTELGNNYHVNIIDGELVIQQKPITVEWDANKTFEYDGLAKSVHVSVINDAVNDEEEIILNSLIYSGESIQAGSHVMRASLPETSDYKFENNYVTTTYEITKRTLTIRYKATSKIYDGQIYGQPFSYDIINIAGTDQLENIITLIPNGDALNAINKGNYTINATYEEQELFGNYLVVIESAQYTIQPKKITAKWVTNRSFTYDGTLKSIQVSSLLDVLPGEEKEVLESLIYSGHEIYVGEHIMVATLPLNSNYYFANDQVSETYNIEKRSIVIQLVGHQKTYDGKKFVFDNVSDIQVVNLAKTDHIENVATFTFTGSAINAINCGTYILNATYELESLGSNYNITIETAECKIIQKLIDVEWDDLKEFMYDGTIHSIKVKSIINAVENEENAILESLQYSEGNRFVGIHQMTVKLPSRSNYYFSSDELTCTYEITKRPLTIEIKSAQKEYDGKVYSKSYEYVVKNKANSDVDANIFTLTFSGEAINAINQGKYLITASYSLNSLGSNYNITIVDEYLTINPRNIQLQWNNTTLVYNGEKQHPNVYNIQNVVEGELYDLLQSITYSGEAINKGTHQAIAIIDNKNYQINEGKECQFDIQARTLTIIINSIEREYDGKVTSNDRYSFKYTNLVSSQLIDDVLTITYSGNAIQAINKGNYTINATYSLNELGDNYDIQIISAILSISPRNISFIWEEKTFEYNGVIQYPKVIDIENVVPEEKEEVIASISYVSSGKNVGTNIVTASLDNQNYNVDDTNVKEYEIVAKKVQLMWNQTSFVYNSKKQSPKVIDIQNVVEGELELLLRSITYSGDGINKGKYQTTAEINNNNYEIYNGETCDFEITPKELIIKIDNQERFMHALFHGEYTYQVIGLEGNDKIENVLTLKFECDDDFTNDHLPHQANINATYVLNELGENYNISIIPGVMSVVPMNQSF